jgi:hypothetical protein
MKEYLIKYRIDTLWNSKGGAITSNHNTEIVTADSAKKAVQNLLSSYVNILSIPTKSIEIESVKLIG